MAQPRTIHDFYGFPQELFDVEYRAPGSPEVAHEVADVVGPGVGGDRQGQLGDRPRHLVGADPHVPSAPTCPVVQLSIDATKPFDYHLDLGRPAGAAARPGRAHRRQRQRRPQPARHGPRVRGARLRLGRALRPRRPRAASPRSPARSSTSSSHADFAKAVPTPDHFLPSVFIAGLAAAGGETLDVLVEGCAYGSLSMTSYGLGVGASPSPAGEADDAGQPARRRAAQRQQPLARRTARGAAASQAGVRGAVPVCMERPSGA